MSDDDLDILASTAHELAQDSETAEDEDDLSRPAPRRRRRHPSPTAKEPTGKPKSGYSERVEMTDYEDNEEDPYTEWKAAQKAREKRQRQRSSKDSKDSTSVATKKRGRSIPAGAAGKQKKLKTTRNELMWRFDDDKEIEMTVVDEKVALPEYLQDRKQRLADAKSKLEKNHEAMDDVFRVPPNYEDIEFSDDERLEYIQSKPNFEKAPCAPYKDIVLDGSLGVIPCSIAQYLRPYQVEGAKFLHKHFVFQEGCILGDDMGLGKTVQVIAFLTAAFGKTGDERDVKRMRKVQRYKRGTGRKFWYPKALIVCPATLIDNWLDELDRWGWWIVYTYHGSKADKEDALAAARSDSLEVMITNYETYRLRSSDINSVHWDCVIADECHKIKEITSETTQRMNEINSLCRIGLSGTAIQNNYLELWTLLNWCRPGAVGTMPEWKNKVAKPLLIGQSHNASLGQLGRARRVAEMLVRNLLPRMFLRRMKTLIADQLPKKTDKVVFCPLTDTQREAYENYLESAQVKLIRDAGDPCDCGSGKRRRKCCYQTDARGRSISELVFPSITWIQKLSNHMANWIPDTGDSLDVRAQKLDILQECLPDRWRELSTRQKLLNKTDPQMCGKWIVLQRLLKFWFHSGDKVLVFSYSRYLLRVLQELFNTTSYNFCYLDGETKLEERTKAVAEFNSNPNMFVFLISTRAGGVGLNITAANKVCIFDPNWNPAFDLQAQDRAYRIGQTRDVEVFRLISAGTIEEVVYARQIYKQQQANIGYGASAERRYFEGVMGDSNNRGELFGLKNLFAFHQETTAVLKDIVNKTNVAEAKAGVLCVGLDTSDKVGLDEMGEELDPDRLMDDEGLGSLSQLADLAIGNARKKKDQHQSAKNNPVAAILADAGVSYTHENSEVIGTSKVEAEISRKAMEATDDKDIGERKAFEDDGADDSGTKYKYNPPSDVRIRQFCSAAKYLGFKDVREFALVVEGWTKEKRQKALERFYTLRSLERENSNEWAQESVRSEQGMGTKAEAEEEGQSVAENEKVPIVKREDETLTLAEKSTDDKWQVTETMIELSDDDEL